MGRCQILLENEISICKSWSAEGSIKLPSKVFLDFMSFLVRLYVPPPLRCYKCQKFGHVAALCRGKQRCTRCGGKHEYGKCGQEVNPKYCNCGGDHSAGYGGCKVRKHAAQVQNVRIQNGLTYSEALKKVGKNLESRAKAKKSVNKIITKAAEKYIEKYISVDMINEKLKMQITYTQPGCGGT